MGVLDGESRGLLGTHPVVGLAEYLTELPPREVLQERLHRVIESARARLEISAGGDVDVASSTHAAAIRGSKRRPKGRK
ncbi:hypothetical protein D7Y21_27555 [Corallococcus sp. AB045]|nr:hypothetical protein D7Y21_27555 [Corallococcus sp. AB045]